MAKAAKAAMLIKIKTTVRNVNGAKISPSAITVPRSFTKQAARIPFPKLVSLNPVSNMTA
jgi:hypothetical protein